MRTTIPKIVMGCVCSKTTEDDTMMDRTRHPAEWTNKYSEGVAWREEGETESGSACTKRVT